ncbi:MAG TPA: ATP-binding protein [Terracidiphilus sp.]|nr:ATP-binding protein [Terracidiphilus sp.]
MTAMENTHQPALLRPTRSIAFRLIAAVLTVELLSAVLVILLSLGYERHTHFHAFDVMLRGRADSVLGAVQDAEDAGDNVMLDRRDLRLPSDDLFAVWDQRGKLLGSSTNWQGVMPAYDPQAPAGFSHLALAGRRFRLLRERGSRIIDPGDPGGGILRRVVVVYGMPTEHVWHAIRGAVEFYAAGSLLLLLVTGPLIAWLLHRGLLPLRQLATLASHVSADSWEFHPPPSARATRELAPLTQALESVLARLERAFVQQRTFVSDAAHELKTAVAVAKSSLQLVALKPRTTAEYHSGLERSLADVARLEDLVAKMLTLARVEGAPAPDAPASCSLAQTLPQIAAELAGLAELRRVRIQLPNPATGSATVALTTEDASLLVSNLLLNALQHSPPGSAVALQLRTNNTSVELAIEDHGEGISPEALPHVFDRFYRGDPSRARSTGGAGLGLAICRAIVEKASGSIQISSEIGHGATVTVRLPRA